MSIKQGKGKNWGSRSGKGKTRTKVSPMVHEFLGLDLSESLLREIVSNPELARDAAQKTLELKARYAGNSESCELVHRTNLGKLYRGDCISLLRTLDDESIDCIFADPPFNLAKEYDNGGTDLLPEEDYLTWTKAWLDLCCQKLRKGGAFYVYNIPKWAIHIGSHLSRRLNFRHWIAVDLTMSMPIPGRLYPSHYSLLYFIKGDKPLRFAPPRVPMETCPKCGGELHDYGGYKSKMNPNGLNLRDVWKDIPPVRHSKYKNRDANELSIKLLDRILDISSAEGDLVFDPFGGSGTTYVVAEMKKRKWLGVELGECEPIVSRLNDMVGDAATLKRYRESLNHLFSDRALALRKKAGLSVDKYRILEEQLERVFGNGCPAQISLEI